MRLPGIYGTLLTLTILVNTLVPQRALSADEINTLSAAIHTQSTVISFCFASRIPLKIIKSYMTGHGLGTASPEKKPRKEPLRSSRCPGDEAIIGQTSPQKSFGGNRNREGRTFTGILYALLAPVCLMAPAAAAPAFPPGCIVLLFFFLLPRSSIDDNAAVLSYAHCARSGFARTGFFV